MYSKSAKVPAFFLFWLMGILANASFAIAETIPLPEDTPIVRPTPFATPLPKIPPLFKLWITTPDVLSKLKFTTSWDSGGEKSIRARHAYVDGIFRVLLGRPSTVAEQAAYVANIPAYPTATSLKKLTVKLAAYYPALRAARMKIVQSVWSLDEHLALEAVTFYSTFFHRNPNVTELSATVAKLRSGMSELELAKEFMMSSEYLSQHASPAGFIYGFYSDMLSTYPSYSEVQFWTNELLIKNQNVVLHEMLYSTTTIQAIIEFSYASVLQRPVSSNELNDLKQKLQNGTTTPAQLVQSLLISDEFHALAYKLAK